MELATRAFNVVTHPDNLGDETRAHFPELDQVSGRDYWRRVLRAAALCHDLGHLPFSHASEGELLPRGWSHERLTAEIIRSREMQRIWLTLTPPLRAEDIVKLSIGPRKAREVGISSYSDLESILSEVIVGDAFGADRMDYLLRDSYHAGVAYGRFDHFRLIDTLRILVPPPVPKEGEQSREPMLGVEEGGLPSAEQMLFARYFMFVQIYYHPIRRVYDRHLQEFLSAWLPGGRFPVKAGKLLKYDDVAVLKALGNAASNSKAKGHSSAARIALRHHMKVLYQPNPEDSSCCKEPELAVYRAATRKFGRRTLLLDRHTKPESACVFPVKLRDGRSASSLAISRTIATLPTASVCTVYIDPVRHEEALDWLEVNRHKILNRRLRR